MYSLTKEEKLKFILETSKKLGISSYEYGQNTEISDLGARNILTGESKNPRTKNLNIMLSYLETKVLGNKLSEPSTEFITKTKPDTSLDSTVEQMINTKIQPLENQLKEVNKELFNLNRKLLQFVNDSIKKGNKDSSKQSS